MSRVDKALRAWEGSTAPSRTNDTVGVGDQTTLTDYAPESVRGEPALGAPAAPAGPGAPVARVAPVDAVAPAAPRAPVKPRPSPVPQPAPAPPSARSARVTRFNQDSAARLVTSRMSAVSLEQYRRLAAALHDAQRATGLKTVMLTSALPHEGKTLTTVNLGLTLSESYDRRVLVIDADLRWPGVHAVLGISNAKGLAEVLADEHLDPPFVAISNTLSVLPAGGPGPTPLAGLSSPRFAVLLEECGRAFDWVLIDTPPVGILPDAQLMARIAGGVILVIGAGETPAASVERAIAELGPECIIGTVLNRIERHALNEVDYYERYGIDQ